MVMSSRSRQSLHHILANPLRSSRQDLWGPAQVDRLPQALEALENGTLTNSALDDSMRRITLCTPAITPEDFQRGSGPVDSDGGGDGGDDGPGGGDGSARARPKKSLGHFLSRTLQPPKYFETGTGLNMELSEPAAIRTRVSSSGG